MISKTAIEPLRPSNIHENTETGKYTLLHQLWNHLHQVRLVMACLSEKQSFNNCTDKHCQSAFSSCIIPNSDMIAVWLVMLFCMYRQGLPFLIKDGWSQRRIFTWLPRRQNGYKRSNSLIHLKIISAMFLYKND